MPETRGFHSRLAAALLVLSLSLPPIAAAQVRFDLPAQPLADALKEIALQAGINIYFDPPTVKGITARKLRAQLSPKDALSRLLAGTRLRAVRVDEHTFRVVAATRATNGSFNDPSVDQNARVSQGAQRNDPTRLARTSAPTTTAPHGTPTDETIPESTAQGLQEITVTAEKISERLIDVPISMTTLTASSLAKLGAVQFADFAGTVPGLDYSTAGAGFTQISMRGVTTGYDVSSTVAIYLDDVPIGSSSTFALGNLFAFDPALFDVQHIEVLRGPQGTLYGASAMGGLIRYVTEDPSTTHLGGNTSVGVSQTGDGGGTNYNVAATINLPLSSDAAVLLSGYETHDGGFIDNTALNEKDVNSGDTNGGLIGLFYRPTDALSLHLMAFLQDTSRNGEATADYTSSGSMPYGSLGQFRPYPGGEPFSEQFRLLSDKLTYDFGTATLTSITGYQTLTESNIWDISSSFAPLCALYETFSCSSVGAKSNIGMHKFTEELRLASDHNRHFDWLVGGFYTRETASQFEYFLLESMAQKPEPNNLYTYYVPSRYEEAAAFGDLTLHITSALDITGGIRYSRDRQEFSQTGSGLFGISKPISGSTENVRNYLGTIRYRLSRNATSYFRYATGYRPGGPNYVTINPATGLPNGPAASQPDSLKEYEIGTKMESESHRISSQISVYKIAWNNIQIAVNNAGFSSITNAPGGATVDGAEFTTDVRPIPALTANVSLAYTHAYMNADTPELGATRGERLPGSPRFTASTSADYQLPVTRFLPTVGITARYVSNQTVDFNGDRPVDVQPFLPGYASVDVRGGLSFGAVTLQLYVHNLLDRRGELSVILPQFGDRVAILQPRTIGMNAYTSF